MKILAFIRSSHAREAFASFALGLSRHGVEIDVGSTDRPEFCDLAVVWGHRQENIFKQQRKNGAHYLVMERGYIGDRFLWTSLGFDGLNGRATFPTIDDGGARWSKYFAQYLKPWRENPTTDIAVIMGQCRGDASLPKGFDFVAWARAAAQVARMFGFSPVFRPHPGDKNLTVPNVPILEGTLEEALAQAAVVETYNSNSGVDAFLAGVPVSAEDQGSMVFKQFLRTREAWTRKMAYTQWLPEEIESGAAWEALRTCLNGSSTSRVSPEF